MKYFVFGGKLTSKAFEEQYGRKKQGEEKFGEGGKMSPAAKAEMSKRMRMVNNKTGKTVQQIAHYLWENQEVPDQYDTQQFRNAVEAAINDYLNDSEMKAALLEKLNQPVQEIDNYDFDADIIEAATDYVTGLSDDEFAALAEQELIPEEVLNEVYGEVEEYKQPEAQELSIKDLKSILDKAEREYKKLRDAFEDNTQQNQKDIFGNAPQDEMLFANDLQEQKAMVDEARMEYEAALNDYQEALQQEEQPENQAEIEFKEEQLSVEELGPKLEDYFESVNKVDSARSNIAKEAHQKIVDELEASLPEDLLKKAKFVKDNLPKIRQEMEKIGILKVEC
jgi:hypothetical protein